MSQNGDTGAAQPSRLADEFQFVVVARHGKRHDSENPSWSHHAPAPWDTPLSLRGVHEVEGLARQLEPFQFQVVVVSPFLRCLQTAHRLISNIPAPPGHKYRVVVDRQLSEVYAPSLLHLTESPSCWQVFKRWWWQQSWEQRAASILGTLPQSSLEFAQHTGWPHYPESRITGRRRFGNAIDYWSKQTKGNVLFVTHGDAVLSSIRRVEPSAMIDSVQPGAFLVMRRAKGNAQSGNTTPVSGQVTVTLPGSAANGQDGKAAAGGAPAATVSTGVATSSGAGVQVVASKGVALNDSSKSLAQMPPAGNGSMRRFSWDKGGAGRESISQWQLDEASVPWWGISWNVQAVGKGGGGGEALGGHPPRGPSPTFP